MPSIIIAPIKITSVSQDSTVAFGDVFQIQPKSTNKTYSGSGGSNIGDFMQTNNWFSLTNTADPDVVDNSTKSVN